MIDLEEINLRPGQEQVAEYRRGKLAVPAVPGAGKTFTLAYLASKLIAQEQVQPGKLLIVTFMNSAVANFRRRIDQFLEQRGICSSRSYEVRTLHSLAMNILRERPDYLLINEDFRIIDQHHQWDLLTSLTEQWLKDNRRRWEQIVDVPRQSDWYARAVDSWRTKDFIKLIQQIISHLKMEGLTREEILELNDNLVTNSYLQWVCEIYAEYSRELARNGWLDFNDLIMNAWKLLQEDQELRTRLQKKWTYVFEDEAQDSNRLQEKILELLAGENGNLVRVGDSNQAITGTFTAADPANFRRFCRRDGVTSRSILYSSRSAPQIIDLANYLVTWSREEHPIEECQEALAEQMIHSAPKDDPNPNPQPEQYPITYKQFATQQQEVEKIAEVAANYAADNPEKTIAIIVPHSYRQQEVVEELAERGVPYEKVGDISQQHQETITALKQAIKYLARPHRKNRLLDLLQKSLLSQFGGAEHQIIEEYLAEQEVEQVLYPVGGELALVDLPDDLVGNPELLTAFKDALSEIRNWLTASMQLPADELVLYLAEELGLKEETLALAQGIALQIKDELKDHPTWRLTDVVANLPELERSFARFARKLDSRQGFEPQPGVISVLNAHKAKGLEWDIVFITSLVTADYPVLPGDKFRGENWYLADEECNPVAVAKQELKQELTHDREFNPVWQAKVEVIKEKIRLIYVAVTRAKQGLFLSAYQQVKRKGGGLDQVGVNLVFQALTNYIAEEREKDAD